MTSQEIIIHDIIRIAAKLGRDLSFDAVKDVLDQYDGLAGQIGTDHLHAQYLWELPGICTFYTIKNMGSKHVRDKSRKRAKLKRIFNQTFDNVLKSL